MYDTYHRILLFITLYVLSLGVFHVQGSRVSGDSLSINLEEVNVVALKQESKLRDDAVSSTVITSEALGLENVQTIKRMSDMVPNLFIPDYGSRITSTIYIRGIGARMDQPAIGLSVDNVPFLNKNLYDFDLADIASIEVLRGPQSTLYGRNTMGGLINITTLNPMRWQGGKVMLELGTSGRKAGSVGTYYKFGDKCGVSVSFNFGGSEGVYKNEYNSQLVGTDGSVGMRTKFYYRPVNNLYIQNAFSLNATYQSGYAYEYINTGRISYNDTCYYKRGSITDGLTINLRNDKWMLTSISSLQYLGDELALDNDFLPLDYFTLKQRENELGITQDVVFKSSKAESKYKWLCGLFGFYKNLHMTAPVIFNDDGIRNMIENNRNNANPDYPIVWDTRTFPLNSDFFVKTFGVALYHESKLDLGNWHFAFGIRSDFEESRLRYSNQCFTGYEIYSKESGGTYKPYRHVEVNIDDRGKLRRHYLMWLPKITALYDLNGGESNLYINISRGAKSGGFNTQMFSEVLQQRLMRLMGIGSFHGINEMVGYAPENSWNYELGAHFTFLESSLVSDISAFYIDCMNQQLTVFPEGTTTGRITKNAGQTRSFGLELSLKYNPLENIAFMSSYGLTDARFVKFNNGLSDYSGKYIPYVPRNTLFLQAVYSWKKPVILVDNIDFELNCRSTGSIFWNEANTIKQNIYSLLGGSITASYKNMSLQLWGRNITNTHYNTFYFVSMRNEFLQRGKPWQIGMTFRIDVNSKTWLLSSKYQFKKNKK